MDEVSMITGYDRVFCPYSIEKIKTLLSKETQQISIVEATVTSG